MVDCRCVLQPDRASSAKHHESRQRVLVFCRIWKWAGGEGREILLIAEKLTYMLQPNVMQAPCGAGGRQPPPPSTQQMSRQLPKKITAPATLRAVLAARKGAEKQPARMGGRRHLRGPHARPRLKKKTALLARPHCPSAPRPFPNPAEYQDSSQASLVPFRGGPSYTKVLI